MILTGRLLISLILLMVLAFGFSEKAWAQNCTPLSKSTKYILQDGEKISEILKAFKLEPILGENGHLEKILKQLNFSDEEQVPPGTEISLPFSCEEQTQGWKIVDRGGDRLIRLEKVEFNVNTVDPQLDPNKKAMDIIDGDVPDQDLGSDSDTTGELSEALRYRMICEGEWTGTECISRYSTLFVLGGAWYNRYDGTDATTGASGVLLTKLNPELGVGWTNYWNPSFRSTLQFSLINNEIHPEIRERPIEQRKKLVNSILAEVRYETGRWGFVGSISQTEKLFYRFFQENIFLNDDGGVVVNAVPIITFRGALSYVLYQAGKYRFDIDFGYSMLQGGKTSGYDVTPGRGLDIALTVQHDRVKEYLFGTLKYEKSHQDTDILIQDAQELGVKFGYAWKLKDW